MRRPRGRLLDNPLSQGNVAARMVSNWTERWLAGPGAAVNARTVGGSANST